MAVYTAKVAITMLPYMVIILDAWGNQHILERDGEEQAYYYAKEDRYYSSVQLFLNDKYNGVPSEEIVALNKE